MKTNLLADIKSTKLPKVNFSGRCKFELIQGIQRVFGVNTTHSKECKHQIEESNTERKKLSIFRIRIFLVC